MSMYEKKEIYEDPITLEVIPDDKLYSFTMNNFTYHFNIETLFSWVIVEGKITHPLTNKEIPIEIRKDIQNKYDEQRKIILKYGKSQIEVNGLEFVEDLYIKIANTYMGEDVKSLHDFAKNGTFDIFVDGKSLSYSLGKRFNEVFDEQKAKKEITTDFTNKTTEKILVSNLDKRMREKDLLLICLLHGNYFLVYYLILQE